MKYLKLFEDKHDKNYKYQWLDDAIEEYFFKDFNIAHNETLDDDDLSSNKNKDKFAVILEYFVMDLNVEYMTRIIEYMKFVEEHGEYKFFVQSGYDSNSEFIGIQAIFDISKLEELEDFMVANLGIKYSQGIKKYNL